MHGHFITIEGGEGSGKTSILAVIKDELVRLGYDVLATREPGGIDIAEQIRKVILHPDHTSIDAKTEALLYAAARRQHLVERVLPALERGKIVICDRFIDSSLAYQGYARGLGMDEVFAINQFAIDKCMPDLTLFLDITPEKGLQRIALNEDREKNRLDLESLAFHELVYKGYHILTKKFQNRIKVVNADQIMEKVKEEALNHIITYLKASS